MWMSKFLIGDLLRLAAMLSRASRPDRPRGRGSSFRDDDGARPTDGLLNRCSSRVLRRTPTVGTHQGDRVMTIGPVEYVIIGFPDNKFTGQIVPELAKLIDSGLVTLLDLTFISKDVDGNVSVVEYDVVEELASFAGLDAEIGGILTDEDIAHAALSLEPNSSAALLMWEDRWAAPFADAVRDANGVILEGARVPHEFIEAAVDALADALASSSPTKGVST